MTPKIYQMTVFPPKSTPETCLSYNALKAN